jgi:Flp pilus assembly protein TadD
MVKRIPAAIVVFALLGPAHCARPAAFRAIEAGVAAARANAWDEAVRQWTRAVEKNPGSAAAHNNLAVAFERGGAWEEARREYETAVRLDPAARMIRENYEAFKARLEAGRRRAP